MPVSVHNAVFRAAFARIAVLKLFIIGEKSKFFFVCEGEVGNEEEDVGLAGRSIYVMTVRRGCKHPPPPPPSLPLAAI